MTTDEFNKKYQAFIEDGFEDQGLMIEHPEVVHLLDTVFEELIQIPDFKYSQIKMKFNSSRFYTTLKNYQVVDSVEKAINKIINETEQEDNEGS